MNERVRSRITGSSSTIRRWGTGLAIALVVAVLSTISATALATSDGADRNIDNEFAIFYAGFLEIPLDDASRQVGDMLDFYQSEFDVDREEAEVQARLDLLGGDVRELAYKQYSDVWAGSWIDREPTYRIVFSFTEGGEESLAELVKATGFPMPERLSVVSARWSLEELRAEQARLSEVRDALYPWTGDTDTYEGFESRIDEVSNTVFVSGPDPERYKTALAGRFDEAMVRFEERPLSRLFCEQDNCDPKMYGGLSVELLGDPDWGCTSGFVVVKNGSQETAVTTAAHCGGAVLQHGGQTMNNRVFYQFWGQVDTQMWSLLDRFWQPDDNIWESSSVTRDVASVSSYWTLMLGDPVWKVGRSTQKTAGVITEFFIDLPDVPGSNTVIRTSADADFGDSGGPVYYGGEALGTVLGGVENASIMIFLAADWWDGNSGWKIATSPPAVPGHDWYLKNTHSGGSADESWQFGSSPRIPVSGDWNGDGRD